jgi:predicted nucleotidyltransferase
MAVQISIDRDAIAGFCRRHHIRRLALFGSVLRDDFRPESDVDVLVEFEREHIPGLIGLGAIEDELGRIFGRRAEIVTAKGLSPYLKPRVLGDAETIYAKG